LQLPADGQKDPSLVGDSLNADSSFLNGADSRLTAPFLQGFNDAAVSIFWVALMVVLVAFALSWLLKPTALRAKSALQENSDNEAATEAQKLEATPAPTAPRAPTPSA
jgi:hypothetical protein